MAAFLLRMREESRLSREANNRNAWLGIDPQGLENGHAAKVLNMKEND